MTLNTPNLKTIPAHAPNRKPKTIIEPTLHVILNTFNLKTHNTGPKIFLHILSRLHFPSKIGATLFCFKYKKKIKIQIF